MSVTHSLYLPPCSSSITKVLIPASLLYFPVKARGGWRVRKADKAEVNKENENLKTIDLKITSFYKYFCLFYRKGYRRNYKLQFQRMMVMTLKLQTLSASLVNSHLDLHKKSSYITWICSSVSSRTTSALFSVVLFHIFWKHFHVKVFF